MGIPSYFHSIIRSRGEHLFLKSKSKSTKIGRLFLDLNCCIHGCKQRVANWWKEHRSGMDILPGSSAQSEFEHWVIDDVIQTIKRFVEEANFPQEVWIMVDGVVPVAKMKQQRMRRLKAVELQSKMKDIQSKAGLSTSKSWDSNAITPGTLFMKDLCKRIHSYFIVPQTQSSSSSSSSSSHLPVKFGGNLVENPGEGEQKIFEYIRKHPLEKDDMSYDMIYGLDADLIMLSLLHRDVSKIVLLREEQQFGKLVQTSSGEDALVWFDVHTFGEELLREWGSSSSTTSIQQYIFLCFLLGNDFVPHTPSIHFHQDGLERLLEAFRFVNQPIILYPESEITKQKSTFKFGVIQWEVLRKILEYLSKDEESIICEDAKKLNIIRGRVHRGEAPFLSIAQEYSHKPEWEYEIAKLDWEHLKYPDTISPGTHEWKSRYYSVMCGMGAEASKTKEKMSYRYFESLEWCWRYYHGYNVSMTDYYEFADAPLIEDLVKYLPSFIDLSKIISLIETTEEPEYPSPETQLIAVLPMESFHLFPYPKMREVCEYLPEFYPIDYKQWTFLKLHDWMCQSILPPIDIERIQYLLSEIM
jgi:5'-3' exonuclease